MRKSLAAFAVPTTVTVPAALQSADLSMVDRIMDSPLPTQPTKTDPFAYGDDD